MANTFKQTPTDGSSTGADTYASIYSAPSSAGNVAVVIGMMITNIISSEINITSKITQGGTDYVFLNDVAVPAGTTLEVMTGNKIVLEAGDSISVKSDTANSFNVFVSSLEIT